MIAIYIILILGLLMFVAAFVLYRLTFSVPKSIQPMPETEQYLPYRETANHLMADASAIPYEAVTVRSFDNLKLFAKCYFTSPDAPWLVLFHGYRSRAERDFCGGLVLGRKLGFNVLLVDQRAHGKSEGRCLTFGILERKDCLSWISYIASRTTETPKIVLYGMSMGAATVMMATELNLPRNVVGIVADCGYTAPSAIIKKVIQEKKLPVFPTYFLLRLGGMVFGGFNLEESSAVNAMDHCDLPVLFLHGEDDRFVPCQMGLENFEHCRSPQKEILTVPGAGHGMSYMVDKAGYLSKVTDFLRKVTRESEPSRTHV